MATTMDVLSLPVTVEGSDVLRRAVAGYLARYKGLSRSHTESDQRVFLGWCTERGLDANDLTSLLGEQPPCDPSSATNVKNSKLPPIDKILNERRGIGRPGPVVLQRSISERS